MPEIIRADEQDLVAASDPKEAAGNLTPRKFLEECAEAMAFYFSYGFRRLEDETARKFDEHLESAINAAFKACKLDVKFDNADEADFIVATMLLSVAVFGPPGRGAPEIWTRSRLAHLDALFKDQKLRNPGKSDIECFDVIARSDQFPKAKKRAKRPSGGALQRQHQMARKEGRI